MKSRLHANRYAQLIVVLFCGAALKLLYSTASVNQLRWILAPTTGFVELISRTHFDFEAHAGYMSTDHTFLIAASCAGVNFLITAFLMLALGKLWRDRSRKIGWGFIPAVAVLAYLATLIANTIRISTALQLRGMSLGDWLSSNQLHRFEGIFIYFGFLLLLYAVTERHSCRIDRRAASPASAQVCPGGARRLSGSKRFLSCLSRVGEGRYFLFPLLVYYLTTLGVPLLNGAYRQGSDFWEHSAFVLFTPLILIVPFAAFRFIWERHVAGTVMLDSAPARIGCGG